MRSPYSLKLEKAHVLQQGSSAAINKINKYKTCKLLKKKSIPGDSDPHCPWVEY